MANQGRRSTTSPARTRRRTYGAVSLLTATALLTTMTGTPSYAHDENVIGAVNNSDYETMTWQETTRSSSLPDVRIETTYLRDKVPQSGSACYASMRHSTSFKNDTSSAQKAKMRAAITAAFDSKRMAGGSTSKWAQISNTGTYRVAYTAPSDLGSTARCPDYLNPFGYSRTGVATARVSQELTDFMVSYTIIGATFGIASLAGAIVGVTVSGSTAAIAAGAVIGCAAGAIGQLILKSYNGNAWGDTFKRAIFACAADGTVGAVSAAAGAWLKGSSLMARQMRHALNDALGASTRYAPVVDDIEDGIALVGPYLNDANRR